MKPTHKQMALKGALLAILAANVSWHTSPTFQATTLASSHTEAATSGGGTAAAPAAGAAENIPVINIAPPPPPQQGAKPDAAISTTQTQAKSSNDYKTICATDIKIHFVEQTEAGKEVVHAYVYERFPQHFITGFQEDGTYQDLIADANSKAQWDDKIHDSVVKHLKDEGQDCSPQASHTAPQQPQAPQQPTAPPQDPDLARDLAACLKDQDGSHPISNSERYCQGLVKLQHIDLSQQADQDDDSTDPRHRTARVHHASIADVQAALEPLKANIFSLVAKNTDGAKIDAQTRLDDVTGALEGIRDNAANSQDVQKLTQLETQLKQTVAVALKEGDDATRVQARASGVDNTLMTLQNQMITANPYQQQILQSQISQLNQMKSNPTSMLNYLSQDPSFSSLVQDNRSLLQLEQMQALSATDYSLLAQPYNNLMCSYTGQGCAIMSMTAPSNEMNIRNSLVSNDPRAYGLSTPGFPTNFNFTQLGMQQPAGLTTLNPGFNQGLPSTMSNPRVLAPGQTQTFVPGVTAYNPTVNTVPTIYSQTSVLAPTTLAVPGRTSTL